MQENLSYRPNLVTSASSCRWSRARPGSPRPCCFLWSQNFLELFQDIRPFSFFFLLAKQCRNLFEVEPDPEEIRRQPDVDGDNDDFVSVSVTATTGWLANKNRFSLKKLYFEKDICFVVDQCQTQNRTGFFVLFSQPRWCHQGFRGVLWKKDNIRGNRTGDFFFFSLTSIGWTKFVNNNVSFFFFFLKQFHDKVKLLFFSFWKMV